MTLVIGRRTRDRLYWGLALASAVVGAVLLALGGPDVFRIWVISSACAAATCMAIGDSRTGLLRNAWTGPFSAAAALQVLVATTALPDGVGVMLTVAFALLVNGALYAAMGLLGWVGFGDVKFMIGLTLAAALIAGRFSMLLPPTALTIAAAMHAVSQSNSNLRASRPHGPALVVAFAVTIALRLLMNSASQAI